MADLWLQTGLDPLMGALVVLTLVDAQLVTLQDAPRAAADGAVELDLFARDGDAEG